MKTITIHEKEAEKCEGIFLVDPVWVHLDEKEIQEKMDKNQKIFKVNFEGEK